MKSSTDNDRVNHTEEDLMWIPGQRPEEFQKYFGGCRISRDQEGARKPSVSEEIIQTVVKYTAVPDYFPLAFTLDRHIVSADRRDTRAGRESINGSGQRPST